MRPGEIHLHGQFYVDASSGELRGKFFLVLAILPSGDFVVRLLTSRQHGRPKDPVCFHGDPYPSFFLGIPGGPLARETWLDLRALDDFDAADIGKEAASGVCGYVLTLDAALFRRAAECAASANDTTRLQERAIRDGFS